MRPVFTLPHTVGAVMVAYAVGVLATPAGGVTGYLDRVTFLTPPMLAAVFAVCGLVILVTDPPPPRFSLLITPILLYAVASAIYVTQTPNAALTAVFAHSGVWLITQAALYDKARGGC